MALRTASAIWEGDLKNGKGKMTSYKALGDDQIKDLVKFVRSLK